MRETLGERYAYRYYAAAQWVATRLPERSARRLFSLAGALHHAIFGRERATVTANLARVIGKAPESPEVRAAVREAFDHYARYWCETFLLQVLPPEEIRKRFQVRGLEHVDAALERGRGAVLCLPHMGNWDAAARWMSLQGYSITAVAETLRPQRLFQLFLAHRQALGIGIVPLSDTGRVGEALVKLLANNELIALVSDRDLKDTGVEVVMFGHPRRLPAGPALLSLSTGAPLIPVAMLDTEEGWLCLAGPPLEIERTGETRRDVAELTRAMAAHFERSIAAAPTQWHMWQPGWPDVGERP